MQGFSDFERIDSRKALCYPHWANQLLVPLTTVRPQDSLMPGTALSIPLQSTSTRRRVSRIRWAVACLTVLMLLPDIASAKKKPHRTPRPEPELKILELKISPNPYTISAGSVEFSALVQLPKELNGATLLEVSSLVSSPSKTSIRFLSIRKPLEPHAASEDGAERPRVSVVLIWDGMDHKKAPAETGVYHYELRAKLLRDGEKGPRTQMVAWPKRGTLEVK